ncbi:hypothetical protein HAX54_010316, partial [Datura stramonium]|nr:hypothetical protein [Datura stramonium]
MKQKSSYLYLFHYDGTILFPSTLFVHLKLAKNPHELNIKATLNRICGPLPSLLELSLPVHN